MIPLFTELLRDFLVRRLAVPKARASLGPPDRTFAGKLPSPGVSLNVFLADLRENRKLGTSERARVRNVLSNTVREDSYPAWVDAHYLISAWDPDNDPTASALSEQRTLSDVSAALLAGDPFTPSGVYAPAGAGEAAGLVAAFGAANATALQRAFDTALGRWPTEFQVPGLHYEVLPPSGFPNLSDFWTTMGQGSVWKPVVYLLAAVPVQLAAGPEYPEVTTISTVSGQTVDAASGRLVVGTEHMWHRIGGRVLRSDGPVAAIRPVPLTRVMLQTPGRNTDGTSGPMVAVDDTRTDDDGRYQFVFAGAEPSNRLAPAGTWYQVVARYERMRGDPPGLRLEAPPLDVLADPTSPFAHDIVLRPV